VDGMNWVEFIRKTEDKMRHIHIAMDEICLNPELAESVAVLTEVLRDYQMLLNKAREKLHEAELTSRHEEREKYDFH
jgi:hypothetical protein